MERMAIVANHMAEVTDWERLLTELWEESSLVPRPEPPAQAEETPLSLKAHMAREEALFIRRTVERCGGDMGKAANALGISRMTLWRKLQAPREGDA